MTHRHILSGAGRGLERERHKVKQGIEEARENALNPYAEQWQFKNDEQSLIQTDKKTQKPKGVRL